MKLSDIPKKNIYQEPDDYFDRLPGVMMTRVHQQQLAYKWLPAAWAHFQWLKTAMAGLALALVLIFIFLLNIPNTQDSNDLFAAVSKNEAMEYLVNSEQLDVSDLTVLSQTDRDLTHEFIQASEEDILNAVEFSELDEITTN
jgi:hypothetical protein